MPRFGAVSLAQFNTIHPNLQGILADAIQIMDFSIVEGHRGKDAQDADVAAGRSKTPWPTSKHNAVPSLAVDVAPYPIDWSDKETSRERFILLAGVILACAHARGFAVRWGGDWNRNDDTRDEPAFRDLPHFELVI